MRSAAMTEGRPRDKQDVLVHNAPLQGCNLTHSTDAHAIWMNTLVSVMRAEAGALVPVVRLPL